MHKLRTLRVLYMYALPLYVVNDWRRASILYSLLQEYITNRKFITNQATSSFSSPWSTAARWPKSSESLHALGASPTFPHRVPTPRLRRYSHFGRWKSRLFSRCFLVKWEVFSSPWSTAAGFLKLSKSLQTFGVSFFLPHHRTTSWSRRSSHLGCWRSRPFSSREHPLPAFEYYYMWLFRRLDKRVK